MQIMTKNITILIYLVFYHREIVKLDHFMTLSLSFANAPFCDASVPNPPFCSNPLKRQEGQRKKGGGGQESENMGGGLRYREGGG
jgi:hypothetical protein